MTTHVRENRIYEISPGKPFNNQKQENKHNTTTNKPWMWEESDTRIVKIYYLKCPVFNNNKMKHERKFLPCTKKQIFVNRKFP